MAVLATTAVHPADTATACGDSLTAKIWYQGCDGVLFSPPGTGLKDVANATWASIYLASSANGAAVPCGLSGASPRTAYCVPSENPSKNLTWVNSGLSGDGIVNLEANVASRITVNMPGTGSTSVLFLFIGINDGVGDGNGMGGTPTDTGVFATKYESVITQTLAAKPAAKIVCMTPLSAGELWGLSNGVPVYTGNSGSHDATIDTMCASIRTLAATYSLGLVDLRRLGALYQSVNNPGNAASGILTKVGDGRHLTTDGAVWVGQQVRSQLTMMAV